MADFVKGLLDAIVCVAIVVSSASLAIILAFIAWNLTISFLGL